MISGHKIRICSVSNNKQILDKYKKFTKKELKIGTLNSIRHKDSPHRMQYSTPFLKLLKATH
jgi:hypothetical protein